MKKANITATMVFGRAAVEHYDRTGQVPADDAFEDTGCIITDKKFRCKELYDAYVEALEDSDGLEDWRIANYKEEVVPATGKELFAMVWHHEHLPHDVSDEELLWCWSNDKNPDYEVERLTPLELQERINNDMWNYATDYVRFIEMED